VNELPPSIDPAIAANSSVVAPADSPDTRTPNETIESANSKSAAMNRNSLSF
jgi:hypothetical protein